MNWIKVSIGIFMLFLIFIALPFYLFGASYGWVCIAIICVWALTGAKAKRVGFPYHYPYQ